MTRRRRIAALIGCAVLGAGGFGAARAQTGGDGGIALPAPQRGGAGSLADVLARRRSVREFAKSPLTLAAVSQLLWAAQGVTGSVGQRTAPSAGGLYPLELYLVAGAEPLARRIFEDMHAEDPERFVDVLTDFIENTIPAQIEVARHHVIRDSEEPAAA